MRQRIIAFFLGFIGFSLMIGLWWLASARGWVESYALPSPPVVAKAFVSYLKGDLGAGTGAYAFHDHAMASLRRVVLGLGLGVMIGISLGLLVGHWRRLGQILDPPLESIRAIPGIAWMPLSMLWFGIGTGCAVFLIALAVIFPVYLGTRDAVRSVPERKIQTARMLGLRRWAILLRLILPACLPRIVVAIRIGIGLSWAYVVLGELSGAETGLGATIIDGRTQGSSELMVVGMIGVAIMGLVSSAAFELLLRLVDRRGRLTGWRKS